jgi:1-acyl-sn-glycerol-3-phosphate acyltransferase
MWLLPALARVSGLVSRVYYRFSVIGGRVPASGPVLLVANHPNSLIDPAMVATAAQRPVRFLAKSTLFHHPAVGWLVRGAAAIPVYRAQDDPAQMGRNREMFSAVHDALASGAAVGIFPEGISHSAPSLTPLKTGAARIALGGAAVRGSVFPIVPIGLVVRDRGTFRSSALAIVGKPVSWDDLAVGGADDPETVRELTARVDAALREVTVNLERWEDAPIVESAEAIHAAELGVPHNDLTRLERVRDSALILAALRSANDPRWQGLADDVRKHHRMLRRLRLEPADLREAPKVRAAIGWSFRRLPLIAAILSGVAAVGLAIFWIPYRLTGIVAQRGSPNEDTLSTHKVLGGAAIFFVWILLCAVAIGVVTGGGWGIAAFVALPGLALATLYIVEHWTDSWGDARRFLLKRRRDDLLTDLRVAQRSIAIRLEELRQAAAVPADTRRRSAPTPR